MVDIKKLRAKMILMDVSVDDISKILGVSPKTAYSRFQKKIFSSDEIEKLLKPLGIKNAGEIIEIFFTDYVA